MKEQTLAYGNHRINYIDSGEGEVLIFLHNGGGFWQIWEHQISHFERTHRVIALDWIGFGESSESEEPLTLDFYYDLLRYFVTRLQIPQFILVGNCIGASVAIKYKQLHPDEIRHLVLMNICPGIRLVRSKIMRFLLFRKKGNSRLRRTMVPVLRVAFTRTPLRYLFPRILFGREYHAKDPLARRYIEKFKQPRQTASRINLLYASDSFTLETFRDPSIDLEKTILLWGSNNRVAGLRREGNYHMGKAGLKKLYVIENAGHLACYEASEKVNELISNHISV